MSVEYDMSSHDRSLTNDSIIIIGLTIIMFAIYDVLDCNYLLLAVCALLNHV